MTRARNHHGRTVLMASVTFDSVSKRYPNGHVGVRDMSTSRSPTASCWCSSARRAAASPPRCGSVAGLEDITEGELRIGDGW